MNPKRALCGRSALRRPGAAFSIIELLLAMTVLVLITLMCSQMFGLISTAWRTQEAQSDVFLSARLALDFMARDMAAVIAANNDNRKTMASGPLTAWYKISSTEAGTAPFTYYTDQVFFVPPLGDPTVTGQKTDLAEVGYFLHYDTTKKFYDLRRRFIDSTAVSTLWDIWNTTSFAAIANWYSTPVLPTLTNTTDTNFQVIASNIWSLQVACYDSTGAVPGQSATVSGTWDGTPGVATTGSKLPTAVLVTIKVYDERAAQRVKAITWTSSPPAINGNWATVVGPNSRTFSTWVQIPNSLSN